MAGHKIPESVLVVIYRDDGQVLLMRRTLRRLRAGSSGSR